MDLRMCLLNPNKAGKQAPAMASYIETSANFTSIDFFRTGFRRWLEDSTRYPGEIRFCADGSRAGEPGFCLNSRKGDQIRR